MVDSGDRVETRNLTEDLGDRGVRRLMVEGGGTVHTQFLTHNWRTSCSWSSLPSSSATPELHGSSATAASPGNLGRRVTLASVRQIGDVVLLRYALSPRFQTD